MSDIALTWGDYAADFSIEQNDLASDEGFETSVMLSLFLDRWVPAAELPAGITDQRGWWGDAFPSVEGDLVGSRLWTLARAKQTEETLRRAEEMVHEALQWMVDDGAAERLEVSTEWVSRGVMGIAIVIHRPTGEAVNFQHDYTWAAQEAS